MRTRDVLSGLLSVLIALALLPVLPGSGAAQEASSARAPLAPPSGAAETRTVGYRMSGIGLPRAGPFPPPPAVTSRPGAGYGLPWFPFGWPAAHSEPRAGDRSHEGRALGDGAEDRSEGAGGREGEAGADGHPDPDGREDAPRGRSVVMVPDADGRPHAVEVVRGSWTEAQSEGERTGDGCLRVTLALDSGDRRAVRLSPGQFGVSRPSELRALFVRRLESSRALVLEDVDGVSLSVPADRVRSVTVERCEESGER